MNFIGREKELEFLEEQYKMNKSSFVIIYGRRRIGKTSLIKEFSKNKKVIYFLATEESINENRKNFQKIVFEKTGKNIFSSKNTLDWQDIFDLLTEEKLIIVIDEYQYMAMKDSSFTSKVQKIWDEVISNKNFMFILCGSLINMMYSETLASSSPIYGRRTGQVKLKELSFLEYNRFFKHKDFDSISKFYALTGGVPKYIETFDLEKDVLYNIKNHVLYTNSYLYEEPLFLLNKEVKDIGNYFSIIRSIANGNHKIGKIASDLEINQTSLGYYLNVLRELEIIEREVPVTEANPEKSKKGLYFIKDNYINFWFKFIYPNRSYIEMGNTEFVIEKIKKNFVDTHVSFVYENICKEKLKYLIFKEKILDIEIKKIGKWWNNNEEIDLVGIDFNDQPIIFGECKYLNKKVGMNVLINLISKTNNFNSGNKYFFLFSKSGYEKELIEYAKKQNNIFLH